MDGPCGATRANKPRYIAKPRKNHTIEINGKSNKGSIFVDSQILHVTKALATKYAPWETFTISKTPKIKVKPEDSKAYTPPRSSP